MHVKDTGNRGDTVCLSLSPFHLDRNSQKCQLLVNECVVERGVLRDTNSTDEGLSGRLPLAKVSLCFAYKLYAVWAASTCRWRQVAPADAAPEVFWPPRGADSRLCSCLYTQAAQLF